MALSASQPEKPGGADSKESREYNRLHRRMAVVDFLLGLSLMGLLLATGWTSTLRDWAYQASGQRYALAVFLYVALLTLAGKLFGLPLDYYGFRIEHRYELSNQNASSWFFDQAKSWIIGLLLATIVVELVYRAIRLSPEWWWILAWAVFVILAVVFAQIAPVVLFPLFYKFEPLENDELRQRLLRLSERAGTRVRGVYEWNLSAKSKKANAALTGLGRTRRIILSDTLLENYSAEEIEAVLAHELGHHVHKHVPRGIAVQMVVTFFGFWLTASVLRYSVQELRWFESLSDFANLPLLALLSTLISFLLLPALNAYSRHNERQADMFCFRSIPTVVPFISSMDKLAEQNLSERYPSRFVELFFHSHPAISRRIAAARAFAAAHPLAPGGESNPSKP
jgi:STE24 endopeptidase